MAVDLVWFRRDLRLGDNPAWSEATKQDRVCPLFVIDPRLFPHVSERRRAVLGASLKALDGEIQGRGGRLRIEVGDPVEVVPRVASEIGAGVVHVNGEVSPYGQKRDEAVVRRVGMAVHDGVFVHGPGSILTGAGRPYRVFTAFHRSWSERPIELVASHGLAQITADAGAGIPEADPSPIAMGESSALGRLESFLNRVDAYSDERDRPDLDTTSRLSIDLKYGTLGPLTVHRMVGVDTEPRRAFIRQLAWRDFFGHLMAAMPQTVSESMRPETDSIQWQNDVEDLDAWMRGMTGFPIVDAGMRQLAAEGWIHNRVRMLVASFMVKDLLIDWRIGERFFRRHLLDGDVAQNVGNWQWVAGTGTDAAPYFRVINPVIQSMKFDPTGAYIKRWVPELSALEPPGVHAPWEVLPLELAAADVTLGDTYPWPIVDHARARLRVIEAFEAARA